MSLFQQTIAALVESNFATTGIEGSGGCIQFAAATAGLTGQQAATIPAEGLNSVWAVVHHITWLQSHFMKALQNEPPGPVSAVWPSPGEIEVSDENWESARQMALDLNRQLAQKIANLTDEQFAEGLSNWSNIMTFEAIVTLYGHINYHTAEIVTIRHIQGLRVNHPFAEALG